MNSSDFIEFFLGPYRDSPLWSISLEIIAALFGIISVYFAQKENILVYPTGLISTVIYVFICYRFFLYGDVIINFYYSIMSLYGWYRWSSGSDNKELPITLMSTSDQIKASAIFGFTALFVSLVYVYFDRFGSFVSYVDILTTSVFFVAMWLMANKKLSHWLFWIVGNVVSVPLYLYKGLAFTSLQYFIFLILAIQGYREWKRHLDNQTKYQI